MVNPNGYYNLRQVCQLTTLSAPTIWRMRKAGLFPPPVRLSSGRVGWPIAVIHLWLSARAGQQPDGRRIENREASAEQRDGVRPSGDPGR